MDNILSGIGGQIVLALGGLVTVILSIVTWAAKKYLLPWLQVDTRLRYATWMLKIADDATDDLLLRYPDSSPLIIFDQVVDKIMEICGVKKVTAVRLASATWKRRADTNVVKVPQELSEKLKTEDH